MRVPKRRGEEEARLKRVEDAYLTPEKMERLKRDLERLKTLERPEAIKETQRLAEMGDFSENVGYQLAKAHLRRINGRMLSIEERLKTAIPIERGVGSNGYVRIGSKVTVVLDGIQRTYEILGSQETNPSRGVVSHLSPLGRALLGHRVGDEVVLKAATEKVYQIIAIE